MGIQRLLKPASFGTFLAGAGKSTLLKQLDKCSFIWFLKSDGFLFTILVNWGKMRPKGGGFVFRKRHEDELWKLQQELLAAEEEECEENESEYEDDESEYDDYDELTDEEDFEEDDDEDFLDPDEAEVYSGPMTRYGRKSQKRFSQDDLFDDDGFEDEDVLYRRDYRKAKRKKRRKKLGLLFLAILEIIAIIALILWFTSWIQ